MSHLQDLTEAHSDNWFSSEIDQSVVSWVPEAFLPDADLIENRVNRFFLSKSVNLGMFFGSIYDAMSSSKLQNTLMNFHIVQQLSKEQLAKLISYRHNKISNILQNVQLIVLFFVGRIQ
jgi:hypothetical protein